MECLGSGEPGLESGAVDYHCSSVFWLCVLAKDPALSGQQLLRLLYNGDQWEPADTFLMLESPSCSDRAHLLGNWGQFPQASCVSGSPL